MGVGDVRRQLGAHHGTTVTAFFHVVASGVLVAPVSRMHAIIPERWKKLFFAVADRSG